MGLSLSSCANWFGDAPKPPRPDLQESIIEQQFCGEVELKTQSQITKCDNPQIKSLCRIYAYSEEKQEYFLKETLALKACHGSIGVKGVDFAAIKNFLREIYDWIVVNCKAK